MVTVLNISKLRQDKVVRVSTTLTQSSWHIYLFYQCPCLTRLYIIFLQIVTHFSLQFDITVVFSFCWYIVIN